MPITKKGKQVAQMLKEFKAFRARLPQRVGTEAVAFFKQSFRRQGWIDEGRVEKWKPRKHDDRRSRSRGILMLRGTLRRSIRVVNKTATSVTVGTDVPYAQIHNEGFRGIQHVRPHKRTATIKRRIQGSYEGIAKKRRSKTVTFSGARHNVRGYSRRVNMPGRRFMGQSKFFDRRIQMQSERELREILDAQ